MYLLQIPVISNTDVVCNGLSTGLLVKKVPRVRGVGVFCRRSLSLGDAVVRYMGETISVSEAQKRHLCRSQVCERNAYLVFCVVLSTLHVATNLTYSRCLCPPESKRTPTHRDFLHASICC